MKYLSLLATIVMTLLLMSCSQISNEVTVSTEANNELEVCSHDWKLATCETPKTCSICGETEGKAIGHSTTTGVCIRCGKNFSAWQIGEYVDEFELPTGKKYMFVDGYGTFSNSATTNSELYAVLQVDKDNIGFMLFEYGDNLVKGIFDYEDYNITILDEKGTKHYYTGTIYDDGTRIYFDNSDRVKVTSLLRYNKSIKVYMESTKYSKSTYLFTLETTGYDSAYDLIK